jgi:hypothetical protein
MNIGVLDMKDETMSFGYEIISICAFHQRDTKTGSATKKLNVN